MSVYCCCVCASQVLIFHVTEHVKLDVCNGYLFLHVLHMRRYTSVNFAGKLVCKHATLMAIENFPHKLLFSELLTTNK